MKVDESGIDDKDHPFTKTLFFGERVEDGEIRRVVRAVMVPGAEQQRTWAKSSENGFTPAFAMSESSPAAELEFDGGITTSEHPCGEAWRCPGSPS